jgi:hypothetical protein
MRNLKSFSSSNQFSSNKNNNHNNFNSNYTDKSFNHNPNQIKANIFDYFTSSNKQQITSSSGLNKNKDTNKIILNTKLNQTSSNSNINNISGTSRLSNQSNSAYINKNNKLQSSILNKTSEDKLSATARKQRQLTASIKSNIYKEQEYIVSIIENYAREVIFNNLLIFSLIGWHKCI